MLPCTLELVAFGDATPPSLIHEELSRSRARTALHGSRLLTECTYQRCGRHRGENGHMEDGATRVVQTPLSSSFRTLPSSPSGRCTAQVGATTTAFWVTQYPSTTQLSPPYTTAPRQSSASFASGFLASAESCPADFKTLATFSQVITAPLSTSPSDLSPRARSHLRLHLNTSRTPSPPTPRSLPSPSTQRSTPRTHSIFPMISLSSRRPTTHHRCSTPLHHRLLQ